MEAPVPVQKHRVRNFDATTTIITVRVGTGLEDVASRDFFVHQDLLSRYSVFMKAKLKPDWEKDGQVDLPHHHPDSFSIYVHWLYYHETATLYPAYASPDQGTDFTDFASADVLGEEIMDADFQDCVLDTLRSRAPAAIKSELPADINEVTNIIYDGTSDQSPARRWLVQTYKINIDASVLKQGRSSLPKDFLFDLAHDSVQFHSKAPNPIKIADWCRFHSHGAEKTCYRKDNARA